MGRYTQMLFVEMVVILGALICLLGVGEAHALEISGLIYSSKFKPIEGAEIAVAGDLTQKTYSQANGSFSLSATSAVISSGRTGVPSRAPQCKLTREGLSITHGAPISGALQLLDVQGRTLFSRSDLQLGSGRTTIPLDQRILSSAALVIVKLQYGNQTMLSRIISFPGAGSSSSASSSMHATSAATNGDASAQAADLPQLIISKAGYTSETYTPVNEVETSVVIMLDTIDTIDPWPQVPPDYNRSGSISYREGHRLLVQEKTDGTWSSASDFVVRGVCYSPTDVGQTGRNFDGNIDRDLDMMVEANINAIRLYSPFDLNAQGLVLLDKCQEHGVKVIMTVFAGYSESGYSATVSYFKEHPAILMWSLGNEFNYNKLYSGESIEACMNRINQVHDEIKAIDPNHAVTVSIGEPGTMNTMLMNVEVISLQIYRFDSFGGLFSTFASTDYRPMLVSEYGADAWNADIASEDQESQRYAVDKLTRQIGENLSKYDNSKVSVGGTIFEWNDEWHKDGEPSVHNIGGVAPGGGPYPDRTFNEEYWGIVDVYRTPRSAYYALRDAYAEF